MDVVCSGAFFLRKIYTKLSQHFDKFMKFQFIIITVLLLSLYSCDEPSRPSIYERTFKGFVIDSITSLPIEGVFICEQKAPDSLVFIGDSAQLNRVGNSYIHWINSDQTGFYFMYFTISRPTDYTQLFAYKSGYHRWRFNSVKDTIIHTTPSDDLLTIRMVKK